jgi:acyl transferase domain-containing protein/acyl carrier protein
MSDADVSGHVGQIAVIGMAGRFPGAHSLDEFWRNLRDGVESITFYSDEELAAAGVSPATLADPLYVKAHAALRGVAEFDAAFFGFTPREAEITDPQQRIFLECAWEALEHSGYDPTTYGQAVGVYAGAGTNDYILGVYGDEDVVASTGHFQIDIANGKDHLAPRVSYKLNLKGPSITVQTGCSTSLVCVHMACQALLDYECDMALAGGVSVGQLRAGGYFYQAGGITSADGHCRAFDAGAQGTVAGSGAGVVVLKRLADALDSGDTIHAVIKGSAVNNDGSLKVGYTAPSVDGQAEVIAKALAVAAVRPETISYVEAHGTATALGDSVEIAALTKAFRHGTGEKGFCRIGSVKTNVGHLNTAAGVAGLIKTVLALKNRSLPPSLHFTLPNPQIDFAGSPFRVNGALTPWEDGGGPLRAGVSSFSIGGTNAHVILEEAPPPVALASRGREESRDARAQLLVLSAKTETALEAAAANLASYLERHAESNLADVAYTLQTGRKAFAHRRVLVARDVAEAIARLTNPDARLAASGSHEEGQPAVAFMFAGQGSQHVKMALDLYRTEPVFRAELDRCVELLKPHLGLDLRGVLYPSEAEAAEAAEQLKRTAVTQPALFAVEYALARLWLSWGVRPQALVGHSLGEYVAACLAGVLSLADAAAVVALRGRLMEQTTEGAMLAVPLSEQAVHALLRMGLSLAAVNGASSCVVSGTVRAVAGLEQELARQGLSTRRLPAARAFHSETMEAVVEEFTRSLGRVELSAPSIPFISNVTGTWITAEEATDPVYWGRHLREPVRFAQGLDELLKEPQRLLLEVGPGNTLSALARREAGASLGRPALASLPRPDETRPADAHIAETLGRLWLAGVNVDWAKLHDGEQRRRVPLPTYPFERERFWLERKPGHNISSAARRASGRKPDPADWFYAPLWKQSLPLDEEAAGRPASWLVFLDECGVGTQLAERLTRAGQDVVSVKAGERFAKLGERLYAVDPRAPQDYARLLRELRGLGKYPERIAHLWGVTAQARTGLAAYADALTYGFDSLLSLAQALGDQPTTDALRVAVVTNNVHGVTGEEHLCPEKATVLGPCKVLPKELPYVTCRSIDIDFARTQGAPSEATLAQLTAELLAGAAEARVALRGAHRWAQTFEPIRLAENSTRPRRLRAGGVYLIAGAAEGIGLALAEHLARTLKAKIAIVSRADLPPRDEWPRLLATHDTRDGETSRSIRALSAVADAGGELMLCTADISDLEQMRHVVEDIYGRFGALHGVIQAETISSPGLMQLKTPGASARALAPLVGGTLVLEQVLHGRPLDFMALCSSITSDIAGFGQADDCAAYSFLDAFAQARNLAGGYPTVAINWSGWQTDARPETLAGGFAQLQDSLQELRALYGLTLQEGVEAFGRVLSAPLPRVVVTTQDFQAALAHMHSLTAADVLESSARLSELEPQRSRPALKTEYAPPRTVVEVLLLDIWQKLFGVEQLGVHDDFLDLGGHSLLALQLVSRVREELQVDLPLTSLFETPTVARLAEKIVAQQLTPEEFAEIEDIYKEIGSLSSADAREQLAAELRGGGQ